MCEVFTPYKLVSVSSTITHHLLFVRVCPCMSLLRQGFEQSSQHSLGLGSTILNIQAPLQHPWLPACPGMDLYQTAAFPGSC